MMEEKQSIYKFLSISMADFYQKLDSFVFALYVAGAIIFLGISQAFYRSIVKFFNWAGRQLFKAGMEVVIERITQLIEEKFLNPLNEKIDKIERRLENYENYRIQKHDAVANYNSLIEAIKTQDSELIKIHLQNSEKK